MKYLLQLLLILFFALCGQVNAQVISSLHIVTSADNYQTGFPFQFEVNGRHHKLKAGHCLELKIAEDSIHIVVKDKRWVNKETVNLHVKADTNVYVRVFWGWKTGEKKKLRCIAEAICKSCFDEYKQKCKKELTE